jgi:excisionase family DNA binding protein
VNGQMKITASHRSRTALVYLRQSTMLQVRDHTESTARQYALADVAASLGWPAENVVVIDADLGVSGRFGSERDGFREVVARVCLGEVGAVFGLEVSRLARSNAEFARLLELARLTDTLVVDGDGVYDLTDINDRLLLGLKGSMSEAELHLLAGRLQGAKKAAAARGELRAPLPVGLVYDQDGVTVPDPDEQVRGAVADVFAEFARTGSAYGVVAAFKDRRFPLRAYGGVWAGQLRWGRLTHSRVLGVLANPAYAGTYVYGRHRTGRRVLPDGSVRTTTRDVPREAWQVVIHDHHEGYITWQQYLDIEAKLKANRTHEGARPPREGAALCQGTISCGACGSPMSTRYDHKGRSYYECQAHRDAARTQGCRSIAAATVDEAVGTALLASLTGDQIALALDAAAQVAERHTRSHRAAELALERAGYEAQRAGRAFGQVEPENRLVARSLEARWEAKLAALAEAEAALVSAREARPPLPERASLEKLAADLPRLWDDPATSAKNRKRLLRTVIADVTLLPVPERHKARIGVRWHTGATEEIDLSRPKPSPEVRRTPPAARDLIARLGPHTPDPQIVTALAEAGITTGTGRPYDVKAVGWVRHIYKIPTPRTAALPAGRVTVAQAAAALGVSIGCVYYWIEHGRLAAEKDAGRRWSIPWNEQVQAACRRQIDESGHLIPVPAPAPALPPGRITVQQAASRLGVLDAVIYYRIRAGQLSAEHTADGRIAIVWSEQIEAECRTRLEHPGSGPTGPGSRPLPAEAVESGLISVQQAATRLSVPTTSIYYWIRAGYLAALKTETGRTAIPWDQHIEAACLQRAATAVRITSKTATTTTGAAV